MPGIGKSITPRGVLVGSNVNQIPAAALASVWLDGTIVDVSGSKYFVDKKGGANVLITGYDFPAGWVKGFPYKSAATIDIFGLTGVPVVSLFQNLDYGNQYFTRHVAQVVDGNGVETSEAYVADIVAYSAPLTGDDLTAANTYFVVPAEITTAVRWIDPVNGLDTNPAGTKAAPWKTINKASTSSTAGDTIYVKSGICVEDYNGTSIRYAYLSKTNTFIGLGKVTIRSIGTNIVVYMVSGNYKWQNIIFDGEGNTTDVLRWYGSNNKSVEVNNCKFMGAVTNLVLGAATIEVSTLFKNSLFIGASGSTTQNVVTWGSFDTCHFIHSSAHLRGNNAIVKNSKWGINNKETCISLYDLAASVLGCEFNYDLLGVGVAVPFSTAKVWSVSYSKFYQNDKASGTVYAISVTGGACDIQHNLFSSTLATFTATTQGFVLLLTMPSAVISNNRLTSATKSQLNHINVQGTGAAANAIKCNYNWSKSNSLVGTQITFGSETATAGLNNEAEFIGNRLIGFKLDYPAEAVATIHAALLNCGVNMHIKYNNISHTTLGLVVKTGTQQAYTANGVYHNLISECNRHIWARGVSGLNIFGNTLIQTAATYAQAFASMIYADENSAIAGTQDSENIVIKNNLLVSLNAAGVLLGFDSHAGTTGLVCDYKNYYSPVAKPFQIGATTYSFAEWQALGHDAHSIFLSSEAAAKALFTSFDAGDYTLKSGANQAVGAGVELAGYTTGLDAATTWGSVSAIPVIVTKENTSLCVGAYVQ